MITRIDLASHIHKWSRTYHVSNDGTISSDVLAMTLQDGGDRVAVWLAESSDGSTDKNYIFIIDANDGDYVTKQAR